MTWVDEPMRWLQLNLVPDDLDGIDVPAWQHYWDEAGVQGLTISAAGASAFYPTDVPLHQRVDGVESFDVFGALVAAAKELGIRVLARFEPNFASHELGAAHPEWMSRPPRTATRAPVTMEDRARAAFFASVTAGRPKPCVSSPYFREFMPVVMTEIASRYPIDGFYANGWPFIGGGPPTKVTCECVSCLQGWRARGHDELPVAAGQQDASWADYVAYVQEGYEQVQHLWQSHLRAIRPDLTFVCNLHGSLASGIRWTEFGRDVDLYVNDSQGRAVLGPTIAGAMSSALWLQAQSASIVQAVAGGAPAFHIVGAWHSGNPMLRRVAREPVELTAMLAQVVARGARPWSNVAGGVVYDRRWQTPLRDYYAWHARHDAYFRNTATGAETGVLWTPEALWPDWQHPGERGPSLVAATLGWHEVLLRTRRPYAVVPAFRRDEDALARYRTVIVPSGSRIDAAMAELLRRHVSGGGGLVLGCGVLAPAAGPAGGEAVLAALAGVTVPDPPAGPHFGAYTEVTTSREHPLLQGLGDTDYLPGGQWSALPEAWPAGSGLGRFQPPLPFLADLAVVTEEPADNPTVITNGRVVYLGTDLDALHGSTHNADSRSLLTNVLLTAEDGAPARCEVTGPGVIDVNLWHQRRSTTVHLVNHTNPQLYAGAFDETYPVGPLSVRVRLDPSVRVEAVRLLRKDAAVDFDIAPDGSITVDVPCVEDFEVVAFSESR